jgi:hypothetical protein
VDIVEAILGGWADQRVMLQRVEKSLPVGMQKQRRAVAASGSGHGEPPGQSCDTA